MPTGTTTLHVLVVDDDDDHRFLATRTLREHTPTSMDVEVHAVASGEEAIDFLCRRGDHEDAERPSLVVLDLRMPKMGGEEVLEHIKNEDSLKAIPVVVLTSSDRPDDVEEVFRRGGASYLVKQTTERNLRETLALVAEYWTKESRLPGRP